MRIITFALVVFLLFSCNDEIKKPMPKVKTEVAPKEKKAEKPEFQENSFMEFFELFLQNPEFQKSRIDFPLLQNGEEVKSSDWKFIDTFENGEFFPYLFQNPSIVLNDESSMETLKVNIIDFQTSHFTDYNFSKSLDKWKLTSSSDSSIDSIPENEFVNFLYLFSQDPDYQKNHITFPLKESSIELDSIANMTSSEIGVEEWEFFNFINEIKFLIIFNLPETSPTNRYIFLRGIDNGISVNYSFQKTEGEWRFVKITDKSN